MADMGLEAVRSGRITIIPERFTKVYYNWLENIRDWCISRQLWWGHRIPAWHCADCEGMTVAKERPDARASTAAQPRIEQDPDVLDTWFSSGLWPFSTLGWPDDTPDLRRYYPTTVMETGYDILFFWVARMIMQGLLYTNDIPFETVYLHGLVRDDQGRKMSKTTGNVLDPIALLDGARPEELSDYIRHAVPGRPPADGRRRAALHPAHRLDARQRHEPEPATRGGQPELHEQDLECGAVCAVAARGSGIRRQESGTGRQSTSFPVSSRSPNAGSSAASPPPSPMRRA